MNQPQSRLLDLLRQASARQIVAAPDGMMRGLADEREPFPFLAIVGHTEMKLALLLAVVNPRVGGVLLLGPRGTAKTTSVRALVDVLPQVRHSLCPNGCTEEMLAAKGIAGICQDCARKAGYGEPLTSLDRVRIVELPLNARYEDVVGGINERLALEQQRVRLEKGLLAQADQNILYIDEINLLDPQIINAILDAAAQGFFTVRRGPQKLTYWSRFLLIGSMNPEEGGLRPQIMDRFGLRVAVKGLADAAERYQAYERAVRYQLDPDGLAAAFASEMLALAAEVEQAQARLNGVVVSRPGRELGLGLIQEMGIASNRAEIALFEAARAYAAIDERDEVTVADVGLVAPLALRLRRSPALDQFFRELDLEDARLQHASRLPAVPDTPEAPQSGQTP